MKTPAIRVGPRQALAAAGALWLLSLALPALRTGSESTAGFEVLLIGWLGPITHTFAWYGNLLWLGAAVLLAMGRAPPLQLTGPGLLLAATCLGGVTVADDGGTYPATLMPGAYVWLASFLPPIAAKLTEPVRFPPSGR